MTSRVHLGLDIGGTASRWVACDAAGTELARGKASGATGHMFNPAERERLSAVLNTIAKALGELDFAAVSLTAGITGYGAAVAEDVAALVTAHLGLGVEKIRLMDDIVLAYVANFSPGEGHLVSAGTGSIGIHVGAGQVIRVGGRGILIDDAGSGSWIALQALDQVYRELDRKGSFASVKMLSDHLFSEIGGASWSDVRQFVYAGDRGRIGSLAIAVARAAEAGDVKALAILRNSGIELAKLAQALIARAGAAKVHVTGGVLRLHPIILDEIRKNLDATEVYQSDADAALAAAQLQTGSREDWTDRLDKSLSIT